MFIELDDVLGMCCLIVDDLGKLVWIIVCL